MLNTQVDNQPAVSLYESERFTALDEPLAVLERAVWGGPTLWLWL
jgi:hypothetical protein